MTYQQPSQTSADKSRQRNELQRNIIMLEADKGKMNMQKIKLVAEIRECDKDRERAKLELQTKQVKLEEVDGKIATIDASIKDLKKKLNLV
jgi:chromosome segregation ATPase